MRTLLGLVLTVCLVAFAFGSNVLDGTVNSKCPVSGAPVKEGVTVETKDGNIGVCCTRCQNTVAGWDASKKSAYIADQKKKAGKAAPAKAAEEKKEWAGEPYLLSVCAASGRPLDVKGSRTTKVVDGRELKFCCGGCADVVAKDPAKWIEKVDEKQIAAQMPIYPLDTCIVSGEPLMEKNDKGELEDIGTNLVIGNRLFRVCCGMCAKKVTESPGKFAEKLNVKAKAAQSKSYPLTTCVVNTKGQLGKGAKDIMIGGRLVRTCCGRCEKAVHEDPAKFVAVVDKARSEKADKAPKADDAAPAKSGKGGL